MPKFILIFMHRSSLKCKFIGPRGLSLLVALLHGQWATLANWISIEFRISQTHERKKPVEIYSNFAAWQLLTNLLYIYLPAYIIECVCMFFNFSNDIAYAPCEFMADACFAM